MEFPESGSMALEAEPGTMAVVQVKEEISPPSDDGVPGEGSMDIFLFSQVSAAL